jgi:hypothetical protein
MVHLAERVPLLGHGIADGRHSTELLLVRDCPDAIRCPHRSEPCTILFVCTVAVLVGQGSDGELVLQPVQPFLHPHVDKPSQQFSAMPFVRWDQGRESLVDSATRDAASVCGERGVMG